jgi:hypothetical protein
MGVANHAKMNILAAAATTDVARRNVLRTCSGDEVQHWSHRKVASAAICLDLLFIIELGIVTSNHQQLRTNEHSGDPIASIQQFQRTAL